MCVTHEKCEVQGANVVFVMQLYPWGTKTLRKEGTYTAMLVDVQETVVSTEDGEVSATSTLLRLLSWMRGRYKKTSVASLTHGLEIKTINRGSSVTRELIISI